MVSGIQYTGFQFGQLNRCKTNLIGCGLAMNECLGEGSGEHFFGVSRCRFDKVSENIVVLDL